jgi:hypothetical protein
MISGQEFSRRETPKGASLLSRQAARFVLAPRQAALYRLVIAESLRTPSWRTLFTAKVRARPARAREMAFGQHEQATLHVPDPERDAAMLCSMVISELQMRFLIGELRAPDDSLIDATSTARSMCSCTAPAGGAAEDGGKRIGRSGTGLIVLPAKGPGTHSSFLRLRPVHFEDVLEQHVGRTTECSDRFPNQARPGWKHWHCPCSTLRRD